MITLPRLFKCYDCYWTRSINNQLLTVSCFKSSFKFGRYRVWLSDNGTRYIRIKTNSGNYGFVAL